MSVTATPKPNLVHIHSQEGIPANRWSIRKFFLIVYTIFCEDAPTGQTGWQIFVLHDSNDVDSGKDVLFGGVVDIADHLMGEIPLKPWFGGTYRRSPAKRVKNSNFHIFETTASTANKFCRVIKATKCLSWAVQMSPKQIQEDRRPQS